MNRPTTSGVLDTYTYAVEYLSAGTAITIAEVEASYVQEDGSLVVFKNASHAIVFAVNRQSFITTTRLDDGEADAL